MAMLRTTAMLSEQPRVVVFNSARYCSYLAAVSCAGISSARLSRCCLANAFALFVQLLDSHRVAVG